MVQRVAEAAVHVDGRRISAIGVGLLVLLGVEKGDAVRDAAALARRIAHLRIFADAEGRMNHSLVDVGGEVLLVSQFTLAADTRKGRRPSFTSAAQPQEARSLYESVISALEGEALTVRTGAFGAMMKISLLNDGPVTFTLESRLGLEADELAP